MKTKYFVNWCILLGQWGWMTPRKSVPFIVKLIPSRGSRTGVTAWLWRWGAPIKVIAAGFKVSYCTVVIVQWFWSKIAHYTQFSSFKGREYIARFSNDSWTPRKFFCKIIILHVKIRLSFRQSRTPGLF